MGGNFDDYLKEEGDDDEAHFMSAYRKTGEAKVAASFEFIETLIENGAKFLLYAHHHSVLDQVETYMQRKRVGYIRIDGHVSAERRHERVV